MKYLEIKVVTAIFSEREWAHVAGVIETRVIETVFCYFVIRCVGCAVEVGER